MTLLRRQKNVLTAADSPPSWRKLHGARCLRWRGLRMGVVVLEAAGTPEGWGLTHTETAGRTEQGHQSTGLRGTLAAGTQTPDDGQCGRGGTQRDGRPLGTPPTPPSPPGGAPAQSTEGRARADVRRRGSAHKAPAGDREGLSAGLSNSLQHGSGQGPSGKQSVQSLGQMCPLPKLKKYKQKM